MRKRCARCPEGPLFLRIWGFEKIERNLVQDSRLQELQVFLQGLQVRGGKSARFAGLVVQFARELASCLFLTGIISLDSPCV